MKQETKKKRRWLRRTLWALAVGGVLMGLTVGGTNWYVTGSTGGLRISPEDAADWQADCVLVLGCGVRPDGTPSHMLTDRMATGIALYQAGAAPKLLLTGDNSRADYDEPTAMKTLALAAGVPPADIFLDYAGFNTYDSLYRAKAVFGVKRVLIVTQGYHLGRALYIARGLGLEARGVASDVRTYGGQWLRELREVGARTKAVWTVMWQFKPKYLGDRLDIQGVGNAAET